MCIYIYIIRSDNLQADAEMQTNELWNSKSQTFDEYIEKRTTSSSLQQKIHRKSHSGLGSKKGIPMVSDGGYLQLCCINLHFLVKFPWYSG